MKNKLKNVAIVIGKFILLIIVLYFFICTLELMNNSFRLIGGSVLGEVLAKDELFNNPLAELMIGILLTVVLQSSSTTTSIIVNLISAQVLSVKQATYMIMGANIGTSITNTFVSLGNLGDRLEFKRAFSGATVHDIFNWLSVMVLLPLEVASGYLQHLTYAIVSSMDIRGLQKQNLLKVLTQPFTSLFIKIDKSILNDPKKLKEAETIIKICCSKYNETANEVCSDKCKFMFMNVANKWSDVAIGLCLLFLSLTGLILSLFCMVKLLRSLVLKHSQKHSKLFEKLNKDHFILDYISILIGCGLTILVQSSSITTSTLVPLVGTGLISLNRMYSVSIGANIGTTITGILSALATGDKNTIFSALQTSFIHLFFNISGFLLWFPVPFLRQIPLRVAKRLGKSCSQYRWFSVVYILLMFLVFPLLVFACSVIHWIVSVVLCVIIVLVLILVSIVKLLQNHASQRLPIVLRDWKFLPRFMRSLRPYDRIMMKYMCFCCRNRFSSNQVDSEGGLGGEEYQVDSGKETKNSSCNTISTNF